MTDYIEDSLDRLEEEYRRICAQGEDYRRIMGEEAFR